MARYGFLTSSFRALLISLLPLGGQSSSGYSAPGHQTAAVVTSTLGELNQTVPGFVTRYGTRPPHPVVHMYVLDLHARHA